VSAPEQDSKQSTSCRLRISRVKAERDRLRRYRILLDGVEVGRIKRNDTWEGSVPPGRHQLRVAIDWKSSPTMAIEVRGDSSTVLDCGPTGGLRKSLRQLFAPNDEYLFIRPGGRES
jgi:hypothetical protein